MRGGGRRRRGAPRVRVQPLDPLRGAVGGGLVRRRDVHDDRVPDAVAPLLAVGAAVGVAVVALVAGVRPRRRRPRRPLDPAAVGALQGPTERVRRVHAAVVPRGARRRDRGAPLGPLRRPHRRVAGALHPVVCDQPPVDRRLPRQAVVVVQARPPRDDAVQHGAGRALLLRRLLRLRAERGADLHRHPARRGAEVDPAARDDAPLLVGDARARDPVARARGQRRASTSSSARRRRSCGRAAASTCASTTT